MKLKFKGTKEVMGITGASLGLGIVGGGLTSAGIGGDIGEQMSQAGVTGASFIKPAVSIQMGGTLIKMIKDINPKKKK